MNGKRNLKALLGLVAVVAGVLIGPSAVWALHPILDVTFNINWFAEEVEWLAPFNVEARVVLLDVQGAPLLPVASWGADLTPNPEFEVWTHRFVNVPDEAVSYRIEWDTGSPVIYDWQEEPPLGGAINWGLEAIDRIAEVWCWPDPL